MTSTSTVGLALVEKAESLPSLLAQLTPATRKAASTEVVVQIPRWVDMTAKVKAALTALASGKGIVNVEERRLLEPTEVDQLADERENLDAIVAWVEKRKEAMKTMVYNHLDVCAETDGTCEGVDRDDKGHLLMAGRIVADERGIAFTRELVNGSAVLTAEALAAVSLDETHPEFGHVEYLASTTPVRVVDEAKVMLLVREKPDVLEALRVAVEPGPVRTSHYKRKA